MFKRILYEDWASIVPIIAFAVTFLVFLVATIRALRIRPEERSRLAALPVEDDPRPRR